MLIALTAAAVAAWLAALYRFRGGVSSPAADPEAARPYLTAGRVQQTLLAVIATAAAGMFFYRWLVVVERWQPLAAHLDGLLLMSVLFAAVILFIQSRPRLFGLSLFALPLLALILGWAVCAAVWTYRPFNLESLHPVWQGLHLTSVYLGTLGAAIAAIAGGMYLFVQYRLRHKPAAAGCTPLASLETLESVIIRTATLGFALLTLGIAAGLVIIVESPDTTVPGWWHTPKVLLAVAAWAVYALVMNVKHTTRFRGARAAWLSILGLALLLAVYGIVTALPDPPTRASTPHIKPATAQLWRGFAPPTPQLRSGGLGAPKEALRCVS